MPPGLKRTRYTALAILLLLAPPRNLAAQTASQTATQTATQPVPTTPPQVPSSFTLRVAVTLSSQAAVRLAHGERIVVYAAFAAEPAPGQQKHADQVGRIDLGHRQVEIPGRPGTATLHVSTAAMPLRWTQGPIGLNINVFSARRTSRDNLLACDFFDGPLDHALAQPIALHCSLIEENQPTRALE